ncbi:DUF6179 domain-containing protein [Lachnospiraceae bacterium ZAX-1]
MKQEYTEEQMKELMAIVAENVSKYTSNESTSVPYHVAQQLMGSILYCMEEVQDENIQRVSVENESAQTHIRSQEARTVRQVYELGLHMVMEKVQETKELYHKIEKGFCAYGNICYEETLIKGMPGFFQRYDARFDACNNILTLEYPLLCGISDLEGIDLIYEYLKRSRVEQICLHFFLEEELAMFFRSYLTDYKRQIFNLSQIVLNQAFTCILLEIPVTLHTIGEKELAYLPNIIKYKTKEELLHQLTAYTTTISKNLAFTDDDAILYVIEYIPAYVMELTKTIPHGNYGRMFPVQKKGVKQRTVFVDGKQMEDENLRKLIDEIQECRFISDKRMIVKESVKSIADFKEVLQACFFGEEYQEIFPILGMAEREYLQKEITKKKMLQEPLLEWEEAYSLWDKK